MSSGPVTENTHGEEGAPVLLGASRWMLCGWHFLVSTGVLALAAALIFLVWYPPPFASLAGGLKLFGVLALVDLVLGPLGTLVVSSPRKRVTEWRRDVAVIVLLQLAAMSYGLWAVYQARPVYLVFEIDRFRVVQAVDVPVELLDKAPAHLRQLPATGPRLVAVRPFQDMQEKTDVTLAALQGLNIGSRPDLWMDYAPAVPNVLAAAKPLETLFALAPGNRGAVLAALRQVGRSASELVYLPLVSRSTFWTVVLDAKTAEPLVFLPIDAFGS